MATDIIETVPWTCDDKDCPVQWHKANYWIDGRGYTVDRYSDGDHESVRKREIPSYAEVRKAWAEYAQFVVDTGTDPLGEYLVDHVRRVKEPWKFHLTLSILGVVCCEARHGGRRVLPQDFPDYVREYLNIDPKGARPLLRDFPTWAHLADMGVVVSKRGWTPVTHIEHDVPRPAAAIARELRQVARRVL